MTISMNVAEAKAKLSELLDAALAGERVVIARAGTPVVTLVPVAALQERALGFQPMSIPSDFFEPLDADQLDDWQ